LGSGKKLSVVGLPRTAECECTRTVSCLGNLGKTEAEKQQPQIREIRAGGGCGEAVFLPVPAAITLAEW